MARRNDDTRWLPYQQLPAMRANESACCGATTRNARHNGERQRNDHEDDNTRGDKMMSARARSSREHDQRADDSEQNERGVRGGNGRAATTEIFITLSQLPARHTV